MGVLRGQWQFLGWGDSVGWGIFPGPPLFNYINIHLYLCVPVWGGRRNLPKTKQSYFILLYFTKVLNVKSLLGLQ